MAWLRNASTPLSRVRLGFTYDDRAAAEQLITRLSESGVRIVIAADGIPEDRGSRNQSFLGGVCNPNASTPLSRVRLR